MRNPRPLWPQCFAYYRWLPPMRFMIPPICSFPEGRDCCPSIHTLRKPWLPCHSCAQLGLYPANPSILSNACALLTAGATQWLRVPGAPALDSLLATLCTASSAALHFLEINGARSCPSRRCLCLGRCRPGRRALHPPAGLWLSCTPRPRGCLSSQPCPGWHLCVGWLCTPALARWPSPPASAVGQGSRGSSEQRDERGAGRRHRQQQQHGQHRVAAAHASCRAAAAGGTGQQRGGAGRGSNAMHTHAAAQHASGRANPTCSARRSLMYSMRRMVAPRSAPASPVENPSGYCDSMAATAACCEAAAAGRSGPCAAAAGCCTAPPLPGCRCLASSASAGSTHVSSMACAFCRPSGVASAALLLLPAALPASTCSSCCSCASAARTASAVMSGSGGSCASVHSSGGPASSSACCAAAVSCCAVSWYSRPTAGQDWERRGSRGQG